MNRIEFTSLYYLSAGLAFAIGLVLLRRRRGLPLEDRLLAAVVPLGVLTLAGLLLRSLLTAPHLIHNSIRLAPTFALTNGYRLYYGQEDGPALCTVYGPITSLVYMPAALAGSPTTAIMVAELMVQIFFWVPLFAVQLKAARDRSQPWVLALAAITCCGFLTYRSEPMLLSAIWVHADAPALAFAVCACGVLCFARTPYTHLALTTCAFFVGLSVWTKFSMAAVPFALLLYLWLSHGRTSCLMFLLHLAGWGIAMSSLLLLIFGAKETIYNTLTLVGNVPWKSGEILGILFDAGRELVGEVLPFGVVLIVYVSWQMGVGAAQSNLGWRDWLRENRWTVFLTVGLVSAPLCIRLRARFGGGENSLTPSIYFLLAATTLALLHKDAKPALPFVHVLEGTVKLVIGVVVGSFVLLSAPGPTELYERFANMRMSGGEIAFEYLKRNPGKAYFTDDPLPALMAEGKAYHFSYGIFVRNLIGRPMSAAEFRAHVPSEMEFVCFAPDAAVIDQGYEHPLLQNKYIPDFSKKAPSDQLTISLARVGWSVFQRR